MLKRGDQFRPPAPPAYDSQEKLAEIEEIKTLTRTFPITQKALYWHSFDAAYPVWYSWASDRIFEHKLDGNMPRAARVYALMAVAPYDAIIACFDAKYTYWAARPNMVDKTIKTLFPDPSHPSYPAAHACNTAAAAAVLAYLFPKEGKAVEAMADEAGLSRVWAGIHFRSDVDAGLQLGREVAALVIQRAQNDGADAAMPFPAGQSVGRQMPWGYMLISFKPDGKLDVSVDGKVEVKDATYKVTGNQLVLGGDPATCGSADQAEGAYQWAFDGKTFSFNAMADKCDTRRLVNMTGAWFAQK